MNQYPSMYPQYAPYQQQMAPQQQYGGVQQQPQQPQQPHYSETQPLNNNAPPDVATDILVSPSSEQQQQSPAPRCPFSRLTGNSAGSSPCQCRLMQNPRKKLQISMLLALLLSAPLAVFSTGFGFVIALIPKCMAFALGFSTTRRGQNSELSQGIFFGFQMFSMLFTLALGFNGVVAFLMAMMVLVFEAFSLVFSGKMACEAARVKRGVPQEDELGVDDLEGVPQEDVPIVAAPEQPVQVFQEVYPQMPQTYDATSAFTQQPAPQPMQYQQQPAQVPQQSELEALFSKYAVQLNLLGEMSFAHTYQDKVRNARLLEKFNGNIQQVVGELVKSQH